MVVLLRNRLALSNIMVDVNRIMKSNRYFFIYAWSVGVTLTLASFQIVNLVMGKGLLMPEALTDRLAMLSGAITLGYLGGGVIYLSAYEGKPLPPSWRRWAKRAFGNMVVLVGGGALSFWLLEPTSLTTNFLTALLPPAIAFSLMGAGMFGQKDSQAWAKLKRAARGVVAEDFARLLREVQHMWTGATSEAKKAMFEPIIHALMRAEDSTFAAGIIYYDYLADLENLGLLVPPFLTDARIATWKLVVDEPDHVDALRDAQNKVAQFIDQEEALHGKAA